MRRLLAALAALSVLAATPSEATEPRIEISAGARLIASAPMEWEGDFTAWSVVAEGDRLFVGSPGSPRATSGSNPLRQGGFITYRLTEGPPYARQVATFACPGSQEGGLSVWDGLVVQSVDAADPVSNPPPGTDPTCASPLLFAPGGLRVVDVREPARPRQVDFEPLVCGVRNQALVPSAGAAYIYTLKDVCHESLASTDLGSTKLRVLKLQRNARGSDLRLVSQTSLPASVECQGWSVLVPARRAVCYGRSRLTLFDVGDPANPQLLGQGVVPGETFYGAAFTPDGRRLLTASAASLDECSGPDDAVGVVRTFDVADLVSSDPASPRLLTSRSTFSIPRALPAHQLGGTACSSVSLSVLAGRTGRAFAVVGWNTAGMTILDVSSPRPREIAYFASKFDAPADPAGASFHSGIRRPVWYRGRVYAPELMDRLGLRVLEVRGLDAASIADQPRSYNPQTQGG